MSFQGVSSFSLSKSGAWSYLTLVQALADPIEICLPIKLHTDSSRNTPGLGAR